MNELQDYLTPEFLEKLTLTDEAKADIILAGKKSKMLPLTINTGRLNLLLEILNVNSISMYR